MPKGLLSARDKAIALSVIEALAIFSIVYHIVNFDGLAIVWSLSIAVAIPAWIFAVKVRVTCGVTTIKGHPCKNTTYGVIFGCNQNGGKHVWSKVFSRLGYRHQTNPDLPTQASLPLPASVQRSIESVPEVVTVRIAETWSNKMAFWLAAVATLCGLVSASTDIAGAIKDARGAKSAALSLGIVLARSPYSADGQRSCSNLFSACTGDREAMTLRL
jgi:hypothetical protein